jgi:hypothetical protein
VASPGEVGGSGQPPPPPPPPGYGPAGYNAQWQQPPYVVQATNGMAIASLVLGILWLYWIGSILALVFGYIAKRQIAESRGHQGGGGIATAGIVLGWIGIGFLGLFVVLGLGVFAVGSF